MCQQCGCGMDEGAVRVHNHFKSDAQRVVTSETVNVLRNILHKNNQVAAHNREHLADHGVLALNLMSSPGSGKTALLEATIDRLSDRYRLAVIEGDLETDNDAARIRSKGVSAIQITTGQTCHLDAQMVHDALHELKLEDIDILFIEKVGNLVCPAGFDLGQHANVVLLAVTEGDDKPAKYPVMFRVADLVLLSKSDLLAVLDDFVPEEAERHVRELSNTAPIHAVSVRKPETLSGWIGWIEEQLAVRRRLGEGAG